MKHLSILLVSTILTTTSYSETKSSEGTSSKTSSSSDSTSSTSPDKSSPVKAPPPPPPPRKKRAIPKMNFAAPTGSGKTTYDSEKAKEVKTEELTITDKLKFKKRVRAIYANFTISYAYKRKMKIGRFKVKLYHNRARKTVKNFVSLAEGEIEWVDKETDKPIKKPFYDGLKFHRVIRRFIMQTGDPKGNNKGGGPGYTIPLELSERLVHDRFGVVSMARQGGDSHGSQFFITFSALPHLNGVNTVFGQVIDGVETLEEVEKVRTDREDFPRIPVEIKSVKIERVY